MKQFLVFIAILLHCNLYAQDFNVEEYIQKGLAAYQNAQYEEAINYLTPCEEYCSQFSDSISKSYDAVLLSIESIAHSALGNHKKALGYGEKASIVFKSLYGENHPNYATSLNNLSGLYFKLGDTNNAIEVTTKAMNIYKQVLGENHPYYATALGNLAKYYAGLRDYSKAVEIGTQAMNIRKQTLGENHPDYANSLSNLAQYYSNLGEYGKAIEIGTQAMNIRKQTLGENHPDYANSLNNLALCYYKSGEYNKSIKIGTKATDILKHSLGENHPNYAAALANLAMYYADLGDYNEAVGIGTKATNILKHSLGENHPDFATSLHSLTGYYSNLGDYSKALEIGTQAMNIRKKTLGENHPAYANSLSNLADCYAYLGDYNKAIEIGTKATDILKHTLGENHPNYVIALGNLANYYAGLGNYNEAIEIGTMAMNIQKKILGENHPNYAAELNNLAANYASLGDYNKAVELGTMAMNIRKEALGENHPVYATSLSNLAGNYDNLGNYNKAVELETMAMNIRKEALGENHPNYATALNNLAVYYSHLGDYNKAVELGTMAMEIQRKTLGENHPDYATSLSNLASSYSSLGNYNKAIELGTQAINIRKKTLGENHPDYATSLSNLASLYSDLGDYNKAIEIGTKATDIHKHALGENHPNYANSLNNLANYYNYLGNYNKAIEVGTQAMNIRKEALGEKHPDYASSLSNLALYNYLYHNYQEAYRLLSKSIRTRKHIVLSMFKGATGRTRQTFWNKNNADFTYFPSFCLKAHDQERNGELYDYSALFTKGLLLNAETNARDVILESGDTAIVKQFDALQSVRIMLNKQYEKPIAERTLNCDSLENVAELMERELIKSSKAYGDFTRSLTITWKDVKNELADGDVAIEFISTPFLDNDSVMYIALALKKGYPEPKLIPLFEERTLKELSNDNPNDAQQLFHLVWNPLLSELEGTRNIYFSPSGALYNVGIENLPISAEERMSDRYNMYRLSSTRLLALHPHSTSERKAALFGGLDYEMSPQDVASNNLKNAYHSEFIAQNRDASADFMERGGFGALPFSLKEVKSTNKLLEANGYECHLFEGKDGTEEAFKSLSGKKVKVMHLSTHGAFVPKKEAKNTKQKNNFRFIRFDDAAPQAQEEDQSLTRSFLVMAGGNMLKNYDSIPEGIDDGILTAQEIAHTDLRGCDLVVLSACETALGDITNEGVMGLQRGFKKAGANTILMSLWKVDDQASSLLLTKFYENLLSKKMPKIDALKKAQDYVRNYEIEVEGKKEKIFSDPKFWTSFILLDGLN